MARVFQSVNEYVAAHPAEVRGALVRVRSVIRTALPHAEETIAYNMPTYKLGGKTVLQFAAWKAHYALYAATEAIVAKFGGELGNAIVDKGTIKFAYSDPVPEKLIGRIAEFRAGTAQG